MAESVFDRVKEIIVNRLGVEEEDVKLESNFFEDFIADEVDMVEVVIESEDEFDIEISDATAETFTTVADLVNFIEANLP